MLVCICISCNTKNQEQVGWSEENKVSYKKECINSMKASFDNDETKTSIYCDCVLDRITKRYPNYEMITRMTPAEKEKYYFICK